MARNAAPVTRPPLGKSGAPQLLSSSARKRPGFVASGVTRVWSLKLGVPASGASGALTGSPRAIICGGAHGEHSEFGRRWLVELIAPWPPLHLLVTLVCVSDAELRQLLHEREIRDVVMRYCRGIDRMDRQLVRSCYHADATDDHGSFSGGVDEFLVWVWPLLERYTLTMHFVGNLLVEVGDDVAAVETYGIAFHRSEDARPQLNLMTGFRYLDRFERRDGEWRIASRVAVTEWSRVDDAAGRFLPGTAVLQGRRDSTDASYALFESLISGGAKRR